jgi:hypothetical protein
MTLNCSATGETIVVVVGFRDPMAMSKVDLTVRAPLSEVANLIVPQ